MFKTTDTNTLETHISSNHIEEETWDCVLCEEKLKDKIELANHLETTHIPPNKDDGNGNAESSKVERD